MTLVSWGETGGGVLPPIRPRIPQLAHVERPLQSRSAMFARKKSHAPITTAGATNDFFSPLWSSPQFYEPARVPANNTGGGDVLRELVLRLAIPREWLPAMELDPELEQFLASLDDRRTVGDILRATPRGEMLRDLFDLLDEGIVLARARRSLTRARLPAR